MKWLNLTFLALCSVLPLTASESHSTSAATHEVSDSPLTTEEQALPFLSSFLRTDDEGRGLLLVHEEPVSQSRILVLSPWDLMELVQVLSRVEVPLSRFGNNDQLTQAWRQKVVSFARQGDHHPPEHEDDLFDPGLVLWDPGFIQTKNEWGQWSIQIGRRTVVQSDLATLSPLEVQQAVEVLTARVYPIEFVLDHLEAFRAQLTIVPRSTPAMAPKH